ncbi:DEAD/DEAH box helicase family protein [Campylobacter sp. MIT 21-1685]|uniref:EcoAI/FtnUII family type I restriction enzme subunit R n=1 Tax=unclassified Campylobacter TaxID=2593542 RepID=UPI00224B8C2A|nr:MULTISPECIES: DEAD/DEAH box helicase family protein [unclassified Campylobacter]MCX2683753.1 DEAD/DEAH box helicase family protein [Campylobacter sp. MIT 21-1684]MCX2752037.1 DEAD/DEAH box helicase family protein [Campylobacter sp. MIT 21-1682]MCX2808237.1 DEAD/DEAH box helicase family protein [Campylobacter sp. MIT 21-1685]
MNEENVKTRLITPSLQKAGWKLEQLDMEFGYKCRYEFSNGRVEFVGSKIKRGKKKKVDYLLLLPECQLKLAIIEAKAYDKPLSEGLSQVQNYAKDLDVPFCYSSNGSGFIEYDFFTGKIRELKLDEFPTQEELCERYIKGKNFDENQAKLLKTPYYLKEKSPRYYQTNAINKTFEAIIQGQKRILLVMATGTGKTYTAFQIVHRLYKARLAKKILYLADRNVLIDQSVQNDFKSFNKIYTKIENHNFDPSYELYFGLYQQFISYDDKDNPTYHYKKENGGFAPDFFDLIIIDECHRGSAREDSTWREILEYFAPAVQIGLTATPNYKQAPNTTNKTIYTKDKKVYISSNIDYFGTPLYTYSLKQGIDDGFLAPYKVVRSFINKDITGYRPEKGKRDKEGNKIPDKEYEAKDFNRKIYIEERTKLVAQRVSEFLSHTLKDPNTKTIVFCEDTIHALDMKDALISANPIQMQKNHKYIMRITGGDEEGKAELENFISTKSTYPVIATTSKLLTTGVDTKLLKLIVIDKEIKSLSEFKQIIGRGTRLFENLGKNYFTILDFTGATKLFADPEFDGEDFAEFTLLENGKITDAEDSKNPVDIAESFPPQEPDLTNLNKKKLHVNGVECYIVYELEQILDENGKLISNDFKAYSKENFNKNFQSLKDFLELWNKEPKKDKILQEFEEKGILIEELRIRAEFKDLDEFDILLNLGFNQATLTRKERAKRTNKILQDYEGKAREILKLLLEKYAEFGIKEIENPKIYQNEPFASTFGTLNDIINIFGGTDKYKEAIIQLKAEIYAQEAS